jgi:hypothetical protein
MIAVQAMAAHHASMECSRRATLHEQPFEAAQALRKAAANASRTFVELLSALDHRRGKGGQQKVTVEDVHVHPGGQAVVGNIATPAIGGGGDAGKSQGEPRALGQLAHSPLNGAVLSPLRGADAERETVSVARDETTDAECTAGLVPDPRQRRGWSVSAGRAPGADCIRLRCWRCGDGWQHYGRQRGPASSSCAHGAMTRPTGQHRIGKSCTSRRPGGGIW